MSDEFADDERTDWWNEVYGEHESPPWETGEPQPALVAVAGEYVRGRVLDVGCGLGTEARHLAAQGHEVVGVDFSETAIERARELAADECPDAALSFDVADALSLETAGIGTFETAVDCGLLHALDEGDRGAYADSLTSVVDPGGRVVVLSFGEGAPTDWGPTPVTTTAFREVFDDWRIHVCRESTFRTQARDVPGTLGVAERV